MKRPVSSSTWCVPRRDGLFVALVMLLALMPLPAAGQGVKADSASDDRSVTLLSGSGLSTSAHLAEDLRSKLSSEGELRLLPIVGDGDVGNINDIAARDIIDLTFVQLDVLNYFVSAGLVPDLDSKINYVVRGHNAEFHLLVRAGLSEIDDLNGMTVNVGPRLDGTYFTATQIFSHFNLDIVTTTFPHAEAYSRLLSGEIDAIAVVDGKPSRYLRHASLDEGVRLIGIPSDDLAQEYVVGELDSADYPQLLARGDQLTTVAVPIVLVAYNWSEGTSSRDNLNDFIERFIAALPALRSDERAFHKKWQEFDAWTSFPSELDRDSHVLKELDPRNRNKAQADAN